jgi:HD-GYP domain-containing protein (c-di-GMP phosphodiesterase class II)
MNILSHAEETHLKTLDRLIDIGVSLSSEVRIDNLLERILESAIGLANADGGTFYRLTEQQTLEFAIIQNKSLNILMGGSSGNPIMYPAIPLHLGEKNNNASIAAHCALSKSSVNIHDAYEADNFDFSDAKAFDAKTGYHTKSVLAIPLINHEGRVLGVLQLINCLNQQQALQSFNSFSQKLTESLASQAAIALSNRLLIDQLYALFESVANLINTAIDEKSPYTGGHCQRVPKLTLMLAEAAHLENTGPLASFKMDDKDRYELKIAGLLHDCGKITTPVHVVDKATKLETIFDRIQLIEARFEVFRKEIKIRYLEACNQHPENQVHLKLSYINSLRQLDEDLTFLKHCNIGEERMRAEDAERVKAIGAQQWDDHLGQKKNLLTDDEIQNLSIIAGTLTQAERGIINHHIVATIMLLGQIPWPDHLKNVTEYAGGHHERMDGKGYPKGLTRDQMSVQARIMGIADIFEALSAADRPYKKGMPLSQSIAIMTRMKAEGHIDPDLFDVFIKHGLHITYAKQYLTQEQLDIN